MRGMCLGKHFFMGDRVCVFKSQCLTQVLKTSKKVCVKENSDLQLFSQFFGNCHCYVQIKSSDYCEGVIANYLNLCKYNFNSALFTRSLEGSHFRYRESLPVSHQDLQISKQICFQKSPLVIFPPTPMYLKSDKL